MTPHDEISQLKHQMTALAVQHSALNTKAALRMILIAQREMSIALLEALRDDKKASLDMLKQANEHMKEANAHLSRIGDGVDRLSGES